MYQLNSCHSYFAANSTVVVGITADNYSVFVTNILFVIRMFCKPEPCYPLPRQDKTMPGPDKTRQDKTREENTRQDKITEDMTRQVKQRSRLPKDALYLPVFCPKIMLVTLLGQ